MNSEPEKLSNYNYPQIQAEINHVIDRCRWADSHHWSSYPYGRPKNYPYVVIQVAYLRKSEWIALIFGDYHSEAVEVIKQIPKRDRYFFKATHNAYLKSRAWCIQKQYFDEIYQPLQQKEEIELEFVILKDKPIVPKPFEKLNLTFYERGKKSS
jgi:hypothetical protein